MIDVKRKFIASVKWTDAQHSINLFFMKPVILLALLVTAASVNAQSLKETLYSGKLKSDTGTVVRKGEDLSTKIDTSTRKKPAPVEMEKPKVVTASLDAAGNIVTTVQSEAAPPVVLDSTGAPVAAAPKDNNKSWKDFMDEFTTTLRTEVMTSKKIKDGTYSVLIEYEIGTDGQVSVNNINCSPENSFLADQVKERLTLTAPRLTPLLGTNGKPRKAIKKQTIILSK